MAGEERDVKIKFDGNASQLTAHLIACEAFLRGKKYNAGWFWHDDAQIKATPVFTPDQEDEWRTEVLKESYAYSFLYDTLTDKVKQVFTSQITELAHAHPGRLVAWLRKWYLYQDPVLKNKCERAYRQMTYTTGSFESYVE